MPSFMNHAALSLMLFAGLGLSIADGNEPEPAELTLTTERVVVFKDGYCLIVKQGVATTDADGMVHTTQVPDSAILGSFWAVPEEGTIKSMVAGWVEVESETSRVVNCKTTVEIIQANLGKKCSFMMGETERLEGTLVRVLSNDRIDVDDVESARRRQVSASARRSATPPTRGFENVSYSQVGGNYFVLKTVNGDMMVAVDSIKNLTIDEMTITRNQAVTTKSRHKRISLDFGKPNSEVKIAFMYFRPGVRWIPTYRIDLTDTVYKTKSGDQSVNPEMQSRSAKVFMQGEILNEAEDLIDVPFHVVVGVPNFRFRTVPSPMTLESDVRRVLAQAAPQIMGASSNAFAMSNALYTQRSSEFRSSPPSQNTRQSDVSLPDELTGSGGNDLFVYELPKMTLKKGERAMVPILETTVGYRDVYTWEINIVHSETFSRAAAGSPSPLRLTENRVWRQVELINNTDIPWTTGAVMFMDGYQPLAQELLTYTSPGGTCRVPVTVSVDLRGNIEDREIDRELKAMVWRGNSYARISGKTDVELVNHKSDPVAVEVQLRFGGKAKRASNDGIIAFEPYRQRDWRNPRGDLINHSSLISWKTTIQPGERFEPNVDYEYFLRH